MFEKMIFRGGRPACDRIAKHIDGQTYMKFCASVCPSGGDFSVYVTSEYDADWEEINDMLIGLMAGIIWQLDAKVSEGK